MHTANKKMVLYSFLAAALCILVPVGLYVLSFLYIRTYGILITPSKDYPIKEVTYFLQADPAWATKQLGNSKQNLAQAGCLVSALATNMTYLGDSTDPDKLNALFTQKNVLTNSGEVIWYKINEELPEYNYTYQRVFSSSTIESYLAQGQLPLIKVKYRHTGIFHWILIIGAENGEFMTMDPLNTEKKPTPLSTHGRVYSFRVLLRQWYHGQYL